jgi:pimeloyl-ACP methyl ester carboxylesterase
MTAASQLGTRHEARLPQGRVVYHQQGSGPPLLFVHGLLVDGRLWRKVVPLLATEFRCIVPNLPLGSHTVPMRPDADLSPPGVARLIVDLLDALELDAATVVANDTGGAFAQILAAQHPQRVDRLVLTPCDALERFFPPLFRYLQVLARVPGSAWLVAQTLQVRSLRRLPLAFGWLAKRPIEPAVLDSYVQALADQPAVRRDLTKVLRGVGSRHTLAAAEALRGFDRPVLLAWAREDRVFPMELARRLDWLLPNSRLEPIDDCYTFVSEDQPERLAELIRDFAGQVDGGSQRP